MHTSPLSHFLAENDVPCPHCGYNLRGLTASVCPECKHDLQLKIDGDYAAIRYLPMAKWLLGLMVFSSLATICIHALYWFRDSGQYNTTELAIHYMTPMALATIECAACVFTWRRVTESQRTGKNIIRAYVICLGMMLLITALQITQWLFQLVWSWELW